MAINDLQLRHDIEAELDADERLDSRQIGVAVKNGAVSLTGHVDSYAAKRAAEEAAQSISGVHAVANDLVVELPGATRRSDAELAESVIVALQPDASIPIERIQAFVHDGWITLEGEVTTCCQRSAAETALSCLAGVKGITNYISINPQASAADIKSRIEDALRRLARLDSNNIKVTTTGGIVTLEGMVHTSSERQAAESAAWEAPGVSGVVDRVIVSP